MLARTPQSLHECCRIKTSFAYLSCIADFAEIIASAGTRNVSIRNLEADAETDGVLGIVANSYCWKSRRSALAF